MAEYLSVRENWLFAMYLGFAFMAGFPILLSWYYHSRIGRSAGAKRLKRDQASSAPGADPVRNFANAGSLWSNLQRGRYGLHSKKLVNRCIKASLVWLAIILIWFGTLTYVEDQVKAKGGWEAMPKAQPQHNASEE